MAQIPTYKKLRLEAGQRAVALNPPGEYAALIGELPEGIDFAAAGKGEADFVHLFVHNLAELEAHIQAALDAVRYDGLLWISYPKGSAKVETDVNRDILWQKLKAYSIWPVMMISIDATWSAMRMRPEEAVGK